METKWSADWNAAFTRQKRSFAPGCRLKAAFRWQWNVPISTWTAIVGNEPVQFACQKNKKGGHCRPPLSFSPCVG
jgi:hypothetical protein